MKKLLGTFFELEEKPETQKGAQVSPPSTDVFKAYSQQPQPIPVQPIAPPASAASMSPSEMEAFVKHIEEIFKSANLPGPDYNEFTVMLNAMQLVADDIKFPAVFSALSSQGLDKNRLIESANHYISIIKKDEEDFKLAVQTEITTKSQQIERSQKSINDLQEKIKEIQAAIENEKQAIATETESLTKIQSKVGLYQNACSQKISEIQNNLTKINQFIK